MGLVLEWVYGTIVSTAEKARDGAKRTLGVCPMPIAHFLPPGEGELVQPGLSLSLSLSLSLLSPVL